MLALPFRPLQRVVCSGCVKEGAGEGRRVGHVHQRQRGDDPCDRTEPEHETKADATSPDGRATTAVGDKAECVCADTCRRANAPVAIMLFMTPPALVLVLLVVVVVWFRFFVVLCHACG